MNATHPIDLANNQYPGTVQDYFAQSPPSPSSSSNTAVSNHGYFRVFGRHSIEGGAGTHIVVTVGFDPIGHSSFFLRLVLGGQGLTTAIRPLADKSHKLWELMAVAPQFDDSVDCPFPFSLSVEVLGGDDSMLDSASVGTFTYNSPPFHTSKMASSPWDTVHHGHLADTFNPARPIGETAISSPYPHRRQKNFSLPRSPPIPGSLRRRQDAPGSLPADKAPKLHDRPPCREILLDISPTISTVCANWSNNEIKVGRRLVRFSAAQDGHQLRVTCSLIEQEDYKESDTVISCIWCKDTQSCFVTSVDIITVVESLVGHGFELEEKNRIRRNLEGFRPKTVSKHRAGSEAFFQQIMAFTAPRPRNIEKDVKVFDWNILPLALEKVLSKYSLFSLSRSEELSFVSSEFTASPPHGSHSRPTFSSRHGIPLIEQPNDFVPFNTLISRSPSGNSSSSHSSLEDAQSNFLYPGH